jgi:hypothetical protein
MLLESIATLCSVYARTSLWDAVTVNWFGIEVALLSFFHMP